MQITELRFPVSGASRDSFRQAVHNTNGWPEIFGKILAAPSAVWGRNKPETQIWALIRADRVRNDYRLLFRFVRADNGEDLHLGGLVIEHGGSQMVTPMTHASMATIIAAKGMYGVRGETRMHHGFAVSSLRGVFPQARNLVVKLALPSGMVNPVIAVPEVEPSHIDELELARLGAFRREFQNGELYPKPEYPRFGDLGGRGRVYRG